MLDVSAWNKVIDKKKLHTRCHLVKYTIDARGEECFVPIQTKKSSANQILKGKEEFAVMMT